MGARWTWDRHPLPISRAWPGSRAGSTTEFAQFIAVCSLSIRAETVAYAGAFSSPWRGKRHVGERRKPVLIDQLQPSINADKLRVRFLPPGHGFPTLDARWQPLIG